jgi:DNA-binding FadR family transcriptional regulator
LAILQKSNPAGVGSFIRLGQEGRTEEVVRRLIEAIDLGLFNAGQQLPSELDLSAQFGVSTVTLREALGYLRQRGVIETRRGRNGGSFVRDSFEGSVELLYDQLRAISTIELRDLGDEQMAIAGASARLAAERSTQDQHTRIQRYIDDLTKATNRRERRRADARFHIEIAAASQSIRLTHAEIRLQGEIGELLWLPIDSTPAVEKIQNAHQMIKDAIVNGDSNLAGALAEAHVSKGIKQIITAKLNFLASE